MVEMWALAQTAKLGDALTLAGCAAAECMCTQG